MSITLSDFKPTNEYIMYEALIHAGILPDDNRAATWNNPEAPIHKAWEEFERELKKLNRQIKIFPHNLDEGKYSCPKLDAKMVKSK